MGVFRGAPQELTETYDHAEGCVISLAADESGDGMQGVEHEMRFDLPAQRCELCLGELLIETRRLGHLAGHAVPRVQYKSDGQYQRVHDQKRQGLIEQL